MKPKYALADPSLKVPNKGNLVYSRAISDTRYMPGELAEIIRIGSALAPKDIPRPVPIPSLPPAHATLSELAGDPAVLDKFRAVLPPTDNTKPPDVNSDIENNRQQTRDLLSDLAKEKDTDEGFLDLIKRAGKRFLGSLDRRGSVIRGTPEDVKRKGMVIEGNGRERFAAPAPEDVPELMRTFEDALRELFPYGKASRYVTEDNISHIMAASQFIFLAIHPLYQGNGRVSEALLNRLWQRVPHLRGSPTSPWARPAGTDAMNDEMNRRSVSLMLGFDALTANIAQKIGVKDFVHDYSDLHGKMGDQSQYNNAIRDEIQQLITFLQPNRINSLKENPLIENLVNGDFLLQSFLVAT